MCVEGTEDFNVRNTEGKSKVQKGSIEKKIYENETGRNQAWRIIGQSGPQRLLSTLPIRLIFNVIRLLS